MKEGTKVKIQNTSAFDYLTIIFSLYEAIVF